MNNSPTTSTSSPKPSYVNAPCEPEQCNNDGLSPIAHSTPSQKSTADSPYFDSSFDSTASPEEEYSELPQSRNNKKPSTASKNLIDKFDIAAQEGRESTPVVRYFATPNDISLWAASDIEDNTNDDKNSPPPSPKKSDIIESDIIDDNTNDDKKSTLLANFLYYSGAIALVVLSVLALAYLPSLLNLKMPRLSSNILFKGTTALASSPASTHGLKQFVTKTHQL